MFSDPCSKCLHLLLLVFSLLIVAGGASVAQASTWEARPTEAAYPKDGSRPLTFGSQVILESCWSPEELAGQPQERISTPSPTRLEDAPQRAAPHEGAPPLPPELRGSIRSVKLEGDQKAVALTFDLCEAAAEKSGYDGPVIDYLRRSSIKATLFAGGKWMRSHPERAMQLIADPLFEVASHSWSHANFRLLDTGEMERQVLQAQAQYELLREALSARPCAARTGASEMESIPRIPLLFRFPYGTCNSEALSLLARLGLPAIQWDVVSGDPAKGQSPERLAQTVLRHTRPGSIIICHANGRGHATAAALPLFVPKLTSLGYRFVTVSELLRLGKPIAASECYEEAPSDSRRYDKMHTGTKADKGKGSK